MGMTKLQYNEMMARLQRNKVRESADASKGNDVPLESSLHEAILEYCNAQWPRWLCIHARMDRRSTIAVGAQDFTIFLPAGKTVLIECKRKGKKPTLEQSAWAMEMERLGHRVYLVTSLGEFMDVLKGVLA